MICGYLKFSPLLRILFIFFTKAQNAKVELREKYSDEEIAEYMLIPQQMTKEEKKESDEVLRAFRFNLLREKNIEQRIFSDLMRLRFQIEDYLKQKDFSEEKTFGKFLTEYVRIIDRTKKRFSEELKIHYSRLSRVINDKEEPNIELIYRLEKHSSNLVPAILWWKLVSKKQEYLIQKNKTLRSEEAAKVESVISFRA